MSCYIDLFFFLLNILLDKLMHYKKWGVIYKSISTLRTSKRILHIPQTLRLEPHHQMQFNVILQTTRVDLRVMVMNEYSIFPKLQNWSLTIKCSLMSYPEYVRSQDSKQVLLMKNGNFFLGTFFKDGLWGVGVIKLQLHKVTEYKGFYINTKD